MLNDTLTILDQQCFLPSESTSKLAGFKPAGIAVRLSDIRFSLAAEVQTHRISECSLLPRFKHKQACKLYTLYLESILVVLKDASERPLAES